MGTSWARGFSALSCVVVAVWAVMTSSPLVPCMATGWCQARLCASTGVRDVKLARPWAMEARAPYVGTRLAAECVWCCHHVPETSPQTPRGSLCQFSVLSLVPTRSLCRQPQSAAVAHHSAGGPHHSAPFRGHRRVAGALSVQGTHCASVYSSSPPGSVLRPQERRSCNKGPKHV